MRIRALAVLAVSALLALTACKATFQDPVLGASPKQILTNAVKSFEKGFTYIGSVRGGEADQDFHGAEPVGGAINFVTTDASMATITVVSKPTDLWLRVDGEDGAPKDWAHLTSDVDMMRGFFGAHSVAETVTALIEGIDTAERVGELRYEGVLDYGDTDDPRTGITAPVAEDLDSLDETEFRATLNPDGSLATFGFLVDDVDVTYAFSSYGGAEAVAEPTGPMTELAGPEDFVTWLFSGL